MVAATQSPSPTLRHGAQRTRRTQSYKHASSLISSCPLHAWSASPRSHARLSLHSARGHCVTPQIRFSPPRYAPVTYFRASVTKNCFVRVSGFSYFLVSPSGAPVPAWGAPGGTAMQHPLLRPIRRLPPASASAWSSIAADCSGGLEASLEDVPAVQLATSERHPAGSAAFVDQTTISQSCLATAQQHPSSR